MSEVFQADDGTLVPVHDSSGDLMVQRILKPSLPPRQEAEPPFRGAGVFALKGSPGTAIAVGFMPCLRARSEERVLHGVCGDGQKTLADIYADNGRVVGR